MSVMPAELPQVKNVAITSLRVWDENPRIIKTERFQNLCKSIEADPEFLHLRPILATSDGIVFAGNQRLRAVQHLGWEMVPAILVDIPKSLAVERAIRDNNGWGDWDTAALPELLDGLPADERKLVGFTDADVAKFLDDAGTDLAGDGLALPQMYTVIVECRTEAEQEDVYEKITQIGFPCRKSSGPAGL